MSIQLCEEERSGGVDWGGGALGKALVKEQ